MKFRISVLMGIYNCADTLQEALNSLYAQTYQGFKIILCDDGSTDETLKVAKKNALLHDNVIVIRNERNMGLNYTLNRCLEYADTEYCARMDGDDLSAPLRFEKEIQFLDNQREYAVVSCPMVYFDEGGEFRRGHRVVGEVVADDFIAGSPICHAPCMIRTDVLKDVGGYSISEYLIRVEDYHLWFKIFSKGYKLFMLDECLYYMRDDRKAYSRRDWKTRRNEIYVKWIGYRMINLPFYRQFYAIIPLLKYLMPHRIYTILHRR